MNPGNNNAPGSFFSLRSLFASSFCSFKIFASFWNLAVTISPLLTPFITRRNLHSNLIQFFLEFTFNVSGCAAPMTALNSHPANGTIYLRAAHRFESSCWLGVLAFPIQIEFIFFAFRIVIVFPKEVHFTIYMPDWRQQGNDQETQHRLLCFAKKVGYAILSHRRVLWLLRFRFWHTRPLGLHFFQRQII